MATCTRTGVIANSRPIDPVFRADSVVLDYLERRDDEFEHKMAQVLCVYREVAVLKETARRR